MRLSKGYFSRNFSLIWEYIGGWNCIIKVIGQLWRNKRLSLCLFIPIGPQGWQRRLKTIFHTIIAFLWICHRENMEYFTKMPNFCPFSGHFRLNFWSTLSNNTDYDIRELSNTLKLTILTFKGNFRWLLVIYWTKKDKIGDKIW